MSSRRNSVDKRRSMLPRMSHSASSAVTIFLIVVAATAQAPPHKQVFAIRGYSGRAKIVRSQGHAFVDVQELAEITKGALNFDEDQIILTLNPTRAAEAPEKAVKSGFSPGFRRAAIEAMASIREWGGMLQVIVENGYPVGKAMAGNTIRAYQGRAADSVALASSVASTDSDRRGLELLRNELNSVQAWSESFVNARNEMRAVNLTMSEHPLKDDEEAQKMIDCGQFLGQMFAAGTFQDDAACH